MTINTDISNPNLTRLAKYMFFIEMGMYFPLKIQDAFQKLEPTLSEDFNPVNIYIQDENVKDYSITEQLESDEPSYVYFILCDTRNPRFKTQLEIIRGFASFVDCYAFKSSISGLAVIRLKVFIKNRINKLFESKYSEMYAVQEYHSLTSSKSIQGLYQKFNYDTKENEFDKSMHVLLRTEKYLDKMIDELGITDSRTIDILSNNEFDSKYSIEQETLRFDTQLMKV